VDVGFILHFCFSFFPFFLSVLLSLFSHILRFPHFVFSPIFLLFALSHSLFMEFSVWGDGRFMVVECRGASGAILVLTCKQERAAPRSRSLFSF
jgi:hypothetical protein